MILFNYSGHPHPGSNSPTPLQASAPALVGAASAAAADCGGNEHERVDGKVAVEASQERGRRASDEAAGCCRRVFVRLRTSLDYLRQLVKVSRILRHRLPSSRFVGPPPRGQRASIVSCVAAFAGRTIYAPSRRLEPASYVPWRPCYPSDLGLIDSVASA
jgi:hypothetical protein